jgi:diguanylate cyclase (GGDEF)-like protein/PAS domain S-box-containing protein
MKKARRQQSRPPGTVELAVEALLARHPNAYVAAVSEGGLIVPLPEGVELQQGQQQLEGRSLIDFVHTEDRGRAIDGWQRVLREGVATFRTRLADDPSVWVETELADMRAAHGVIIAFILPPGTIEPIGEGEEIAVRELPLPERAVSPRYCWVHEDEGANVLDCDDSFTRMFGYLPEEIIGQGILDHIHPEDRGRAVESWLQMLSSGRDQYYRCRRLHKDGHWMWVDVTLRNYLGDPDRGYVLVELIDVSEEMRVQEALAEREELLSRITETMPVGILQIDDQLRVIYHNPYLLEVLGVSLPKRAAPTLDRLLSTLTTSGRQQFDIELSRILADGRDRDLEVDAELGEQGWRRVLFAMRALHRDRTRPGGVIIAAFDITERARARMELERRAAYDSLTKLLNRQEILERVERELADQRPTGLIYVDLDSFKPVNDRYGHAAGDELLQLVAQRLQAAIRKVDDVGRLGGDEFIVLLRNIRSPEAALRLARRINKAIAGRYHTTFGTVPMRASVGVACVVDGETHVGARKVDRLSAEELINLADEAMYAAKGQEAGDPVLAQPLCRQRQRPNARQGHGTHRPRGGSHR